MSYAILRDGRVIFAANTRHTVMRLAATRSLAGTPCRYVFGTWQAL